MFKNWKQPLFFIQHYKSASHSIYNYYFWGEIVIIHYPLLLTQGGSVVVFWISLLPLILDLLLLLVQVGDLQRAGGMDREERRGEVKECRQEMEKTTESGP